MTESIIEGAPRLLQRSELRELHIEANEESKGGRGVVSRLAAHGFRITGRHVHGGTTDLTFSRVPPDA